MARKVSGSALSAAGAALGAMTGDRHLLPPIGVPDLPSDGGVGMDMPQAEMSQQVCMDEWVYEWADV